MAEVAQGPRLCDQWGSMWFVGCEHAGKGLGWPPPLPGVPSSPGQRAAPFLILHVQPTTSSEGPGHGQLPGKCVEYWIHRRMRKPRCHHRGVREEGRVERG